VLKPGASVVMFASAVAPPIAPLNVVVPPLLAVSENPPSTVLPKLIALPLVVVLPVRVTAPL
jgi:hypothetical protein